MKSTLKALWLLIKIVTVPFWLPAWVSVWCLRKFWKILLALLLIGAIAGCGSMSNRFDKSPCACEFKPLNASDYARSDRA